MSYVKPNPKTGLTPRMEIFVQLYCNYGERGGARAYRDAGYKSKEARQAASKLLDKLEVQRRIKEIMDARPGRDSPMAYERIAKIAESGADKDALAASKHLLALGGMSPAQQYHVDHQHAHEHTIRLPDPGQLLGLLRAFESVGAITIDHERLPDVLSLFAQIEHLSQ